MLRIRARYDGTREMAQRLAKRYGTSVETVRLVANRQRWTKVAPRPGDWQPPAAR